MKRVSKSDQEKQKQVNKKKQVNEKRAKNKAKVDKRDEAAQAKVIEQLISNPFVGEIHGGNIFYTEEFYTEFNKHLESGLTPLEAYETLGFNVLELGNDRAYACARRAKKKSKEVKKIDKTRVDGSIHSSMMGDMSPEQEFIYLKSRVEYLESVESHSKKKTINIGGTTYVIQDKERDIDKLAVFHCQVEEEKAKGGYSVSQLSRMHGINRKKYNAWLKRRRGEDEDYNQRQKILKAQQEKFRKIIAKLGFVPGKKTFKLCMERDHGEIIAIKTAKKIMKSMNLTANRPKKDAYKKQATSGHPSAAGPNYVDQDFKRGVREVILSDITYLYYGWNRTVCYLCAFKDACTSEILGFAIQSTMTVELLKEAYNMMLENYTVDTEALEVYIHHDQGSQYLSTSFKELLSEDGFIQSVSARGYCFDNAPMESFFSRLKTELLDIIALCPNLETVKRLVGGYINSYNTERYQYGLAGLTPAEFYLYRTTGIYPLDNYHGVKASELLSIEELVETRLRKDAEAAAIRREKRREKREEAKRLREPIDILLRDYAQMKKKRRKWKEAHELADAQLGIIDKIMNAVKGAIDFYKSCPLEIREELKEPQNWKNHVQLQYVEAMEALY